MSEDASSFSSSEANHRGGGSGATTPGSETDHRSEAGGGEVPTGDGELVAEALIATRSDGRDWCSATNPVQQQRQEEWEPQPFPSFSFVLTLYRLFAAAHLTALVALLAWRFRHPNRQARWLWATSVVCESWFIFTWALQQLPKLQRPLRRRWEAAPPTSQPELPPSCHRSTLLPPDPPLLHLPAVDVFFSVPPSDTDLLSIANSLLSLLASDYPPDKIYCYLSDDSASLLTFDVAAAAASFARLWLPFCRKHSLHLRHPDAYFSLDLRSLVDPRRRHDCSHHLRHDFIRDRRRVLRRYDEFKVHINGLCAAVRRRSDAYNMREEVTAGCRSARRPTWMSEGRHWPGAWLESAVPDHLSSDHPAIVQVMLAPPGSEPVYGRRRVEAAAAEGEESDVGDGDDNDEEIDMSGVDVRLPSLVYVSREKKPDYDHQQEAGAMNALLRCSAVMSNAPFVLALHSDDYVLNPLALRSGVAEILQFDNVCFVRFRQRYDSCSAASDGAMAALNAIQGPFSAATGCMFRRLALYARDPPRHYCDAAEAFRRRHLGSSVLYRWLLNCYAVAFRCRPHMKPKVEPVQVEYNKGSDLGAASVEISVDVKEQQQKDDNGSGDLEEDKELVQHPLSSNTYGGSVAFGLSVEQAAAELVGGPVALGRENIAEALALMSCWYEDKTEWGRSVGWVYGMASEMTTGYRMQCRGWRSIYCDTVPEAFRRSATPSDWATQLQESFRWAAGAVNMFLSRDNALFAGRRMMALQRLAYLNAGVAPFTSAFLLAYCFLPPICLLSDRFIVAKLDVSLFAYLLAVGISLVGLAVLEMRWAGMTLEEWWHSEQVSMIEGASAHLAAAAQGMLKAAAGVNVNHLFGAEAGAKRWRLLLAVPLTLVVVNGLAAGVATARAVYGGGGGGRRSQLVGGLGMSAWVVVYMYPLGRGRRRPPVMVWMWVTLLSLTLALLWAIAAQIYAVPSPAFAL